MLDGTNATLNRIVGNWIGFTGAGRQLRRQPRPPGQHRRQQQHHRHAQPGRPQPDRQLGPPASTTTARAPTTTSTQNNVFCIRPDGGTATCSTGIDHNFGPKNGLIGGNGTNELNVFGPTQLPGRRVLARLGSHPPVGHRHQDHLPDQQQPAHRQLARLPRRRHRPTATTRRVRPAAATTARP